MRAIPLVRRKSTSFAIPSTLALAILCALALCAAAFGQDALAVVTQRPLIAQPIDEARLTTLKGNTHRLARPEFDLGTAPASLPMARMLLVLKRSPEQESTLHKLLDDQQDKKSPSYHKWLTPAQYGKQFGPTDADIQTITSWLQSHGFQIESTKGRTVIEFSGSASQVLETFHTAIHKYVVAGEQHWANSSDPQIPTALTPAVAGVLTLHNFIKKPQSHFVTQPVAARIVAGKKPQVSFPQTGQPSINALGPEDYAVIYNINPVYQQGISGQGKTIGVIGRSNLFDEGSDIQEFRNVFGTCCGIFEIVLNGPDPGDLGGGEEAEATLDASWSGAIAPNATVNFVVSATTNTTDGIDLSEVYIIENNLADIMTESFSSCELFATDAELAGTSALAEQAAAQGITYFVSSGDDGAEGCDDPNTPPATNPISVNLLASTQFNVAVGGTMFNENGNAALYWSSSAPISESALSYIPEDVWNESSLTNGLWSSSGGASAGNILSGGLTQGISKPVWQTGVAGIPSDGVRDLPDVSLSAAGHDPYLLCLEGSCEPDSQGEIFVYFISGTSASTPSFAGVMALVDQGQTSRQGQANYTLYRLAASQSSVYPAQCNGSTTAGAPATTCIFNDVTVGNNVVPGETGSQYQAAAGYDLTTGLGSVNVANLVANWSTVTFNPTTTTLALTPTVTITHGAPVNVNISVAPSSGTGTPTGDVALLASTGIVTGQTALEGYTLSGGAVINSTQQLPGGTSYSVWAHYAGDATYAPSDSNMVAVTVTPEPSVTTETGLAFDQNGNSISLNNVPYGSFVYVRADVQGLSGQGIPTGTVTFTDTFGAIPGGNSFLLNSEGNTANPNGINFDAGQHTVSASYSGDASFNTSSSTQSVNVTITPGFFVSIASSGAQVLISAPGMSGQTSMNYSNSTGFTGTIALACSGLPAEATCAFSPSSITANGTVTNTTVSITVTTTAATAARQSRPSFFLAQWVSGVGLLFSMFLIGGKQHRLRGLFLLLMLMMIITVPGCGGGGGGSSGKGTTSNPGTATGVYNVAVTGSSGSTSSTTGFTLNLQ